ncbi:MAG: amidophosphoribosyltransferase, partial [Acidimicrobiales bacterium]
KRVVMVDDSIVRGTTSGPLVRLVREAGATEVHVRITCPPIAHPCFFGVDMGSYDQLIAHQLGVPEIASHIGADSLGFISVERMMAAIGSRPHEDADPGDHGYCNACFTGQYPVPVQLSLASTKQRFDGVLG